MKPTGQQPQMSQISMGSAIAQVIAAIPLMVWAVFLFLLLLFIGMAVFFNHTHLSAFTTNVLTALQWICIASGAVIVGKLLYHGYLMIHDMAMKTHERSIAHKRVERAALQNEQLRMLIEVNRQLPDVMKYAMSQGYNVEVTPKGDVKVTNYLSNVHSIAQRDAAPALQSPTIDALPTNVRYEDVREQVPQGHVLVGVGASGIETKERAVGACVWIVGLSGTGKTSTTVLRVEERYASGHKFMGVDPHFFKPDSLTNAIAAYAGNFLYPMARTPEETGQVLQAFLSEFQARKLGQRPKPWQPITLLVDEVGALIDTTDKQEEENAKMLHSIARICGQEARNFEMGGIFISQQATGLAWLRKVALMIIVHQLLMKNEKELACNGDATVMEDMKRWPIGRTYVYGVGFQEGPRTVQQPYFTPPLATGEVWEALPRVVDAQPNTDALPIDEDLREALEAWNNGATGPRAMQRALGCTYYRAQQLCSELATREVVERD